MDKTKCKLQDDHCGTQVTLSSFVHKRNEPGSLQNSLSGKASLDVTLTVPDLRPPGTTSIRPDIPGETEESKGQRLTKSESSGFARECGVVSGRGGHWEPGGAGDIGLPGSRSPFCPPSKSFVGRPHGVHPLPVTAPQCRLGRHSADVGRARRHWPTLTTST
jgi:hypothetical protein